MIYELMDCKNQTRDRVALLGGYEDQTRASDSCIRIQQLSGL